MAGLLQPTLSKITAPEAFRTVTAEVGGWFAAIAEQFEAVPEGPIRSINRWAAAVDLLKDANKGIDEFRRI